MTECTYCGNDADAHDPICVRDCEADCARVGTFCNYACLVAYVETEGLTTGDACEWEPS